MIASYESAQYTRLLSAGDLLVSGIRCNARRITRRSNTVSAYRASEASSARAASSLVSSHANIDAPHYDAESIGQREHRGDRFQGVSLQPIVHVNVRLPTRLVTLSFHDHPSPRFACFFLHFLRSVVRLECF